MKCQPSGLNTAQFDLGWLFFSKWDGVHQLDKPLWLCVLSPVPTSSGHEDDITFFGSGIPRKLH